MKTIKTGKLPWIPAGAAVAAIVLLAGCSASGDDDRGAPTTPADSRPLDAYLGGFSAEQPGDTTEEQRQVEELIATCMKAQGFEYIPREPIGQDEQQEFAPDERDWVAEFGYGITTIGNGMIATDTTDPNQALIEAMDDSERDSYFSALWGPPAAAEGGSIGAAAAVPAGGGAAVFAGSGTAGCAGKAQTEIFGEQTQIDFAEYEDLFGDVAALEQKIEDDPRVAPGLQTWVDCMSDAGFPDFSKVRDAQDSIMQQWADLNGFQYQSGGPGGMAQGMTVTMSSEDEAKEPDPAEVAKLRAEELKLAPIDFDCAVDYQTAIAQVRFELQTAFIADHLPELEKYRDAINGGK